jgi:hypothetical protein
LNAEKRRKDCTVRELVLRAANELEQALGVRGWFQILCAIGAPLTLGYYAAKLVGFPLYPGFQGILAQQPLMTAVAGVLAGTAAMVLAYAAARLLLPAEHRQTVPAVAAVAWAGLSMRAGSMTSVLQAAGGREVYWHMAGELVLLAAICSVVFMFDARLANLSSSAKADEGKAPTTASVWLSIIVQFAATVAAMLLVGKGTEKGQSLGTVMLASLIGSWVAFLMTGCLWRQTWMVPLIAGVLGYAVNALVGGGLEVGTANSFVAGLGIASPMDYVGVSALGVAFGEVASRREHEADQEK